MKLKLDIVKYRVLCLCISALLIIPCFGAMIYSSIVTDTHTPVKVSIDYTGGTILQYALKDEVSSNQLTTTREALAKKGITGTYLQILNVDPTEANGNTNKLAMAIIYNNGTGSVFGE